MLHAAIGIDDYQCGLRWHFESCKDVAGVVADLGKREPVLVDEPLKVVVTAEPRNADKINLAGPPDTGRLDRGGFSIARASSGRPKPHRNSSARVLGEVQRPATQERRSEPKDFGRLRRTKCGLRRLRDGRRLRWLRGNDLRVDNLRFGCLSRRRLASGVVAACGQPADAECGGEQSAAHGWGP